MYHYGSNFITVLNMFQKNSCNYQKQLVIMSSYFILEKFHENGKKEISQCMTIQADGGKYEAMPCYNAAVSGICVIDSKIFINILVKIGIYCCNFQMFSHYVHDITFCDLILDCDCSKYEDHCFSNVGTCYKWPKKSISWFRSRNWCFRKLGHLLNKSNTDQYTPPYSVTSKMFYWIGLRKTDWMIYNKSGISFFIEIEHTNSNLNIYNFCLCITPAFTDKCLSNYKDISFISLILIGRTMRSL